MSLGNIFKALAPIAAGAAFGPGGTLLAGSAGTAGSAVAAGALTGAGIAALSGDDPLMGAISGGMGGYGGSGIGEAMSGTAADAALAETATGYGAGPVQFQNFADPGKMTAVTSDMFSNPISPTVAPRGTLSGGFKDPKAFLSNLGGGSTGKGAAKLGAVGLPAIGQAMVPEYNANPDDDPMSKYDPNRRLNLGMTTGIQNALTRDSGLRLNQPFARFAQGGRAGVDYDSTRPSGGNMELMYKPFFGETGMDFFNIERGAERRTPGVDPFYPEADKMMIMRRQLDNEIGQLSEELRMQGPFLTDDSRRELETAIDAKIYARNIAEPTFERQMAEDKNTGRSKRIGEALEFYRPDFESDLNMAQGGYLETGMGDGMSDDIPSSIDGEQPAALSENEFVVPADVVSGLGNGSSDAGAEQLYAMMDRVRKARTGTEKMGKEVNAERLMPA